LEHALANAPLCQRLHAELRGKAHTLTDIRAASVAIVLAEEEAALEEREDELRAHARASRDDLGFAQVAKRRLLISATLRRGGEGSIHQQALHLTAERE